MDGLKWKTLLKCMIWGYHYFRQHPYNNDNDNTMSTSNFFPNNQPQQSGVKAENGGTNSRATPPPMPPPFPVNKALLGIIKGQFDGLHNLLIRPYFLEAITLLETNIAPKKMMPCSKMIFLLQRVIKSHCAMFVFRRVPG